MIKAKTYSILTRLCYFDIICRLTYIFSSHINRNPTIICSCNL